MSSWPGLLIWVNSRAILEKGCVFAGRKESETLELLRDPVRAVPHALCAQAAAFKLRCGQLPDLRQRLLAIKRACCR